MVAQTMLQTSAQRKADCKFEERGSKNEQNNEQNKLGVVRADDHIVFFSPVAKGLALWQ